MSLAVQGFIALLFGWWLAERDAKRRSEQLERNLRRIHTTTQEGL